MIQPTAAARPVIAATAVAAPVASALAVASFHTHVSDPSRQLDLIRSNVAGFTGMILLENLTWVCIAVACVATAVRIKGRGAWPAAAGALLAVVGAAGSLGGWGAALPTLARQTDRSAAVWFVNHVGPIYSINGALASFTLIGLLLTFVALWRARLIHVVYLGVFLLGAALLSFAVQPGRHARLLRGARGRHGADNPPPATAAPIPGKIVLPAHDHVAA